MKIKKVYESKYSLDEEKKFFKFIIKRYLNNNNNGDLHDTYSTSPALGKFTFNFSFYRMDEDTLYDMIRMKDFFERTMNCVFRIGPGDITVRFVTSFEAFSNFLEIENYENKTIDEMMVSLDAKKYNL